MHSEGNVREARQEIAKLCGRSVRSTEADVNNLTQFIEDRLIPQFPQSLGGVS